eukprot:CAMPEP_0118873914 /NCGR_PEP_ID=MMETSP1163-20130328/15537_1 /TAXON_ID=124430 /ORGANISM="Phaeomonas parva, Strain CCMP2877" /LENGTH=680 /DNA_ID=CAMNT_0006809237 /DNA_START=42 /DNA_END=2084 /DNA_ORIENTATION=+
MAPRRGGKAGGKRRVKGDGAPEPKVEKTREPAQSVAEEDDLYAEPVRRVLTPRNQIRDLTEEQLKDEIARVLTATDPQIPHNIVKYNYQQRQYRQEPPGAGEHLAIHFAMDGNVLHNESVEAKTQVQYEEKLKEDEEERRKLAAQEAADAGDDDIDIDAQETGKNQFNYSERAAQTFNNPLRTRGVATEPPPVASFAAMCTQWDIYDSYMTDFTHRLAEESMLQDKKTGGTLSQEKQALVAPPSSGEDDMVHSEKMGVALKILERMTNQNAEDEIFQDFKFWEDASDQFREGEGSLLPLWRFSTERTKRKQVTALAWNPHYQDLFAVGYGSYDFMRQGSGMICCFTLKNTAHPEYIFSTEAGVMCLDFHPQQHSLLAVGCYDGTVMVFDVRNKTNRPIYTSTIRTGKHTDPVWNVYWQEEDLAKELNFFSISSDGHVANWIMSKNELKMEPMMQLKLVNTVKDDPEETSLSGLAGGCCIDFSQHSDHLFIVGTEEGKIHKCSKAYSGQYLETYHGHHMAVYTLKWNPFHERVFISCSADWTVKIWDHNVPYPIMSFDLGNAVGDVMWSPYSATVFCAVTSDGKVHVFDLSENKHEPLCEQKVVKRAKLTHVQFNSQEPIIIVGDDRGGVNSLKLSPNLRLRHEPVLEEGAEPISEEEQRRIQQENMERLLQAADAKPPSA